MEKIAGSKIPFLDGQASRPRIAKKSIFEIQYDLAI